MGSWTLRVDFAAFSSITALLFEGSWLPATLAMGAKRMVDTSGVCGLSFLRTHGLPPGEETPNMSHFRN